MAVKVSSHSALLESNRCMRHLRISAISYLNTAPLMWDFEHGERSPGFEISYTVPSGCAAALREGTADIGIIPSAAYATIPELLIIPGVAIASLRPVRSILLVSSVPLHEIRSVALDSSSLTSAVLTKVLFAKWWGKDRTFHVMAPDIAAMLKEHDAGLVIGDPALHVDRSRWRTYDLAEEWIRLTGKPFVFAFWAVRLAARQQGWPEVDLSAIFQDSRDRGLQADNLDIIAREWAARVGLSEPEIKVYLTENIHYQLDSACLEGLRLFYRYAAEVGAFRQAPALRFLQASSSRALIAAAKLTTP
jgi:chorismate dehydratase